MRYKAYNHKTKTLHNVAVIDLANKTIRYKDNPSGSAADAHLKDCVLMDSVSMTDIEGNDLYVGDIVEDEDNFQRFMVARYMGEIDGVLYNGYALMSEECKFFQFDISCCLKIGNIHESPTLFKKYQIK